MFNRKSKRERERVLRERREGTCVAEKQRGERVHMQQRMREREDKERERKYMYSIESHRIEREKEREIV